MVRNGSQREEECFSLRDITAAASAIDMGVSCLLSAGHSVACERILYVAQWVLNCAALMDSCGENL